MKTPAGRPYEELTHEEWMDEMNRLRLKLRSGELTAALLPRYRAIANAAPALREPKASAKMPVLAMPRHLLDL